MSDLISRQDAIDAILQLTNSQSVRELYEYIQEHNLRDMWSGGIIDAIDAVIAVPSAQPEPEQNTTSEQPVSDRLGVKTCKTCTDTISRQAAINAINSAVAITPTQLDLMCECIEKIEKLPSAQSCSTCRYRNLEWHEEPCDSCTQGGENCHYKPEKAQLSEEGTTKGTTSTGFWQTIERGEHGYSAGDFRCSICGEPNPCYRLTAYCPNCGAKMEKG